MRKSWATGKSWAACLLLGSVALPAFAQPIAVDVKGCRLRRAELDRLVRLELGSVLDADSGPSGYQVTIDCDGNEWILQIEDPITRKALERSLHSPAPSVPEPERLLALSVAQLYRAAWLELLAKDPPPLPASQSSLASPRHREAARQRAEAVIPKEEPHSARVAMDLGVSARGLVHQPIVMPSLGWDLGWGFSEVTEPVASADRELADIIEVEALAAASETAPPFSVRSAAELFRAADDARGAGNAQGAIQLLGELVRVHPKDPRVTMAVFTMGRLHMQQGRAAQAAQSFESCGNALGGEALAEAALAHAAAGNAGRSRALASQYLERFAEGLRIKEMARLAGR